jgi:hypothetical protein
LISPSLWTLYERYVVQLDPILHKAGQQHGVHIDTVKQDALRGRLEQEIAEVNRKVQDLVPRQLKPRHRYKSQIPEGDHDVVQILGKIKRCTSCGTEGVTAGEHTARKGGRGDVPLNVCYKAPIEVIEGLVPAYDEVLDFNLLSTDQLAEYVKWAGHPMGRNRDTGAPSLDEIQLEKLIKRFGPAHPIYSDALRARALGKVKSTYVDGYRPDASGRIFGQFNHNPETFRLAQKNVNLMNVSHQSDALYATEIRETIIPSLGHVFVEADSTAIEAVFTGIFMGDTEYVRLAKSGIHAKLCCDELGIPFTDENKALVKKLHPGLYERKKRTVHGSAYGMGPKLLAMNYPKAFANWLEAKAEQDKYFAACPNIQPWWESVRKFAHKHGYLDMPWGLRNQYYQVYRKENGETVLGEDAKAVIAFKPQSAAGFFMRDSLLAVGQTPWVNYLPANGSIHDSICLDVPEDRADAAVEFLGNLFTRTIPQMGGITVGTEIKVGKDWGNMKPVKVVA